MRLVRPLGRQGMALISAYLVLSVLLLYSSGLTMRTGTQRLVVDRLEERTQAVQLAQGALDQLKENLYTFLSSYVTAQIHQNDTTQAFGWLDDLATRQETPPFDYPLADGPDEGTRVTWADVDGTPDATPANPRCVDGLPRLDELDRVDRNKNTVVECVPVTANPIENPIELPRAWIVSVTKQSADLLAPRLLTLQAEARVGSVTKRLQAQYEIAMGTSDIFKYGYFVNNYGWFSGVAGSSITVNGEVRANGDLDFSGNVSRIFVNGDLYASENPLLINPVSGEEESATGTITGDPAEARDWLAYWNEKASGVSGKQARPARRLAEKTQPPIGGVEKLLPLGSGWDDTHTITEEVLLGKQIVQIERVEQRRFERQPTHDIPYLGNLGFYEQLAVSKNSSLRYNTPGADGRYGTADDVRTTLQYTYKGPDGTAGNQDDKVPLVLVGTEANPIVLNGPFVVPGDVIIKGVVTGRGTIYAGRNIHVVDAITYQNPPEWRLLEREGTTGILREKETLTNLGAVCSDGTYVRPGDPVPTGCI